MDRSSVLDQCCYLTKPSPKECLDPEVRWNESHITMTIPVLMLMEMRL